jgi:hypothetical protein
MFTLFLNAQYYIVGSDIMALHKLVWNDLLELVCRQYKNGDGLDGYTVNTTSGVSLDGCSYYNE